MKAELLKQLEHHINECGHYLFDNKPVPAYRELDKAKAIVRAERDKKDS